VRHFCLPACLTARLAHSRNTQEEQTFSPEVQAALRRVGDATLQTYTVHPPKPSASRRGSLAAALASVSRVASRAASGAGSGAASGAATPSARELHETPRPAGLEGNTGENWAQVREGESTLHTRAHVLLLLLNT